MSLSDDGGYGGDSHRGPETGQTRTRLPDNDSDIYGPGRRSRTGLSSRNLVTIVGVIVLLLAAIAFANRGGSGNSETTANDSPKDPGHTQPTAPTGTKAVDGKTGGIASGFAKTEQGAQSAAANFAVALGSSDMFNKDQRHKIVNTVMAPSATATFQNKLDDAYSPDFFKTVGLKADGSTPPGMTFVSRTIPVGTKTKAFAKDQATVEVWCTGLLGMAGEGSVKPVTTSWFTLTMKLAWTGDDWKTLTRSQTDGPAPVSGDVPASGAKDIAGAVQGYGGFTYAR
ncbi:hypothetical protein [Streptomyces platensis]|uniref:hypothetical protein n=1 Tax=Streptomyces platensis TaxID=58346 RepID=UPI002E820097|nr:hypothetical protein [Streptomyces platensis]WUB80548.1 hypothetical protein OG424_15950 [Streptomyces platensis]